MSLLHKFEFDKTEARWNEVKKQMPMLLANTAQNTFLKSFKESKFDGKKWDEVKRRLKPAPKSDPQANYRGILIGKTRNLMHSIAHSIREANMHQIRLGTDVAYAAVHNDGLRAGRGRGFIMKKRRFMGDSKELRAAHDKNINGLLKHVFKAQ